MDSRVGQKTEFQEWVDRKVRIARRLNNGDIEGSYYDSMLIVSALIGCFASFAWPRIRGERNDQARFVEAWVRLTPPGLGADRVSLPLIVADLERGGRRESAAKLRATHRAFPAGHAYPLIPADAFDLSADKMKETAPELEAREIRKFSYGSVFYGDVRSALVHEYQLGRHVEPFAGEGTASGPNYATWLEGDVLKPREMTRRPVIHFPFVWLEQLVRGVAENVEPVVAARGEGKPRPERWWLHGG